MKKFLLLGMLAIMTLLSWSACDSGIIPKSLCDGVLCYNKGICIDGTCDCKYGWSGTNCDSLVNECGILECGLNSIDCFEGVCNCKDGYEGDTCSILSRAKFLGTFDATEICDGATLQYICTLDTVTGSPERLQWINFHNLSNEDTLVLKAVKSDLSIPNQLTTHLYRVKNATGYINFTKDTVTFDYTLTNVLDNITTTCRTILVRQ